LWLTSAETSGTFTGEIGHQYSFYSGARDNVGNVEDASLEADASTTITSGVTPNIGTYGTEITIEGHDFGGAKGKVLIGTIPLKITSWGNSQIHALISKTMVPGTYNITIQPKEKGFSQIVLTNGFTVKAAEIHSIDEGSGTAYDQVTIKGKFFGTKKGKVYLEYEEGGEVISKGCKVIKWFMDPVSNVSEIIFVVPKMLPAVCDVVVDPYSTLQETEEEHGFEVKDPEIDSVQPGSGSVGEQITISGNFFGSKKPKVYLGYLSKGKPVKKSCSVLSWGDDEIIFVVPKLPLGTYHVIVTDSVGSDTLPGGFVIK
jgi:hypothetical protein